MSRWILIALLFASNAFAELDETLSVKNDCKHDEVTFRCVKYLKAHDGDTITVEIPNVHPLIGHNISIRVNGIDTPEIAGHGACERQRAREAQELVQKTLATAKRIDLVNVQRDKYFRILADVMADGKPLKQIVVAAKLAYEYHGKTKQKINWCDIDKKRVLAGEDQK